MTRNQNSCPGQSTLFWRKEDIFEVPCLHCKSPLEFFKNDVKRTCPRCKQVMLNPRTSFACAEWCSKAEECLGPVIYGELMERKDLEARRSEHFHALLETVPDEDQEVLRLFTRLFHENSDPSSLLDFEKLGVLCGEDPKLAERATDYYRRFIKSISRSD